MECEKYKLKIILLIKTHAGFNIMGILLNYYCQFDSKISLVW